MSADYTTVGLVAETKRRGFIPAGSGLTTSDILKILTGQLRNYIPAFLKSIREEYLIATTNVAVTSALVRIPARACGVALRAVGWLESDGLVTPITRTEPERAPGYGTTAINGRPSAYVFRGNSLVLVPAVTSGTVVLAYQQRPGELVLPTSCATVFAYDDAATLLVNNLPSSIEVGALCDVVGASPNFPLKGLDLEVTSVINNGGGEWTVAFSEDLPTDFVLGDFVCLATETCIPQIPLECFDLLAQAAAVEIAQSTGSDRLAAIQQGLKDLREQVMMILSPRSDGSARMVVSRSRVGRRWY